MLGSVRRFHSFSSACLEIGEWIHSLQRFLQRLKKSRGAKRFVQDLCGSLPERLLSDIDVLLSRDEDDGNLVPAACQFLLKIKSGHSRHRDVEDQAFGLINRIG